MTSSNNNAINTIADQIITVTKQMIKEAPFNREIKTTILAYLGNNKYLISIDGEEYAAVSENARNIGDIVSVTICNNNFDNLMIRSSVTQTNESSEWTLETEKLTL